ncbi:chromate transporter [Apiospora rasikravindrae]|uniref:Chromate transporter n=1 Tax=Apiospora rasikravindrae TaxID=990691 RepID=A0ABR1SDK2_9PEZI
MLYCINLIHGGVASAILSFILWCLPGALGMLGLSIGVSNVGEALPEPVYSLLSGLNAATVGIITLAAVELSDKAVTDQLTRIIVFLTASAGMLYNALWYFPVLVFVAGCATVVHDYRWVHRPVRAARRWLRPGTGTEDQQGDVNDMGERAASSVLTPSVPLRPPQAEADGLPFPPRHDGGFQQEDSTQRRPDLHRQRSRSRASRDPPRVSTQYVLEDRHRHHRRLFRDLHHRHGPARLLPQTPPFLFRLFANMYLAGTIIFGGGPVVIPLLREYVVAEGWVSPRDFLVGLAVAQAFPGPNFNFAVFLGSLAAINQARLSSPVPPPRFWVSSCRGSCSCMGPWGSGVDCGVAVGSSQGSEV